MPPRKTRNVSLTPRLDAFVDGRVAAGRYRSASEVVRAALRLLEEAETPRREDEVRPPRPADAAPDGR
jgi:antitoxin ParD1/3/4